MRTLDMIIKSAALIVGGLLVGLYLLFEFSYLCGTIAEIVRKRRKK